MISRQGSPGRVFFQQIIFLVLFLIAAPGGARSQDTHPSPWEILDSSHKPPPSSHKIWKVIPSEYRAWYIRDDSTIWGYNNGSPYPVRFPIANRKAVSGAGGFNYFRVIDDQGYIWTSRIDYTTNTFRIPKDSTGSPFDGNRFVDAYAHVCLTIRADSSVWYFGIDAFSLFYPGGDVIRMTGRTMLPTRLSPPGMKFRKVLFGGNKLLGLTSEGRVYEWRYGNRNPVLIATPRPAVDIFITHLDAAGCIIPDPGETSGMGYPFVWGTINSMYGSNAPYNTPTSVRSLWKMTAPVREITTSSNTIHYIDSLGRMYGIGFNSLGEVGNGVQFVNKHTYPGFPGYGWTYVDYENPSGAPPAQIGAGIKWKHIWSNNWFNLYTYAQDEEDGIYSWGRNKSLVLGNGLNNLQDRFSPDALDVLVPTRVHPLSARFQNYNFTPPSIHAGPDQTIKGPTASLRGSATPPLLIKATPVAANGIDTIPYRIVSWRWTKIKGAGGKITSPNAPGTTVTGLSPGIYVFNLQTTDNNTGTQGANVTITVKSAP
jgi:hypothetical protein